MNPGIKRSLLKSLLLLLLTLLLQGLCACNESVAEAYYSIIFKPLQYLRSHLCDWLPFSIGDVLYLSAVLWLLYRLIRMLLRISRRQEEKRSLVLRLLSGFQRLLLLYLVLLLGWGGNYYRKPLPEVLQLPAAAGISVPDLFAFDSLLVSRLNCYSIVYHYPGKTQLDEIIRKQYPAGTVTRSKASLFGSLIAYAGIEGYFNPFSGEAQIDSNMPGFMQPFVIAHELAHQTGVAAEDDANLRAYICCVESGDSVLRYSAYLNIWMYTHRKVRSLDSAVAGRLRRSLNPVTLAQLDTLNMLRRRYNGNVSAYSGMVYDAYLRLGNQAMGIESYRNVALTALCWERRDSTARKQNRTL